MRTKSALLMGSCVAAVAILAAGCGFLGLNGDPRDNIRPEVFITNFPPSSESNLETIIDTTLNPDGSIQSIDTIPPWQAVLDTIIYLANPRIYWYGTDVDGRVDAFEYAVLPTDSLAAHPAGMPTVRDSSGMVNAMRFTDPANEGIVDTLLDWIELLPPNIVHSAIVSLFAEIDTTLAVDQFLFVRAIDNLGLRSTIKFARYSRQNHPPNTYIDLDTIEVIRPNQFSDLVIRARKYYSLPQATATYPGITVGWSGSDSTDYPDEQPPFQFNWVLFGPFADYNQARPDSSLAYFRRTNDNVTTPRIEWTDQDRTTFFNLRSGWYLFWVRSRDDAFVSDPTPAMTRFQVVEPAANPPRDYLLMDATNWSTGGLGNVGAYNFRDPRPDSLTKDTLRLFYNNLFSNHGYAFSTIEDVWYRQTEKAKDAYRALPDRDVMAQYKAVIIYDEDVQVPLDKDNEINEYSTVLSEYLSVGGRVVLIGRHIFGSSVTGWEAPSEGREATFTGADFGYIYFGVTHMNFPGHIYIARNALPIGVDSADFTGTIPLNPDFPPVTVDTLLTLALSQLPTGPPDRNGDGEFDWWWCPEVNWIGIDRNRGASGIYQFNSYLPNTSPSQGRICGVQYEFFDQVLNRPTFRTAVLTFPLSIMKRDANLRIMVSALLDYIME